MTLPADLPFILGEDPETELTAKPTLFTINGTSGPPTILGFSPEVGSAVQNVYTWSPLNFIPYTPFNSSLSDGSTKLIAAINACTGKFALCGYSQGAWICSLVYIQIMSPSGQLYSRRNDFLGGVMFGNPMRQEGYTFEGGITIAGHGINSTRLVNSGPNWYEMANPGDPMCTCVDGNPTSEWEMGVFALLGSYNLTNPTTAANIAALQTNPTIEQIGLNEAIIAGFALLDGQSPHSHYDTFKPIAGDSRNSVQVACGILETLASTTTGPSTGGSGGGYTPLQTPGEVTDTGASVGGAVVLNQSSQGSYGIAPNYANASLFDLIDFNNPYNPINLNPQLPPANTLPFVNELVGVADQVIGMQEGLAIAPDPVINPWSAYTILQNKSKVLTDSMRQRPLLRLWDRNMNYIAPIANEISASLEEIATDSGQASIVVKRDDWLTDWLLNNVMPDEDLNITMDPVPTQPDWRTRWGGKVTNLALKRDHEGIHTIEFQCTSNREHLKHILMGANPIFPPEVQFPKMWFFPGNTRTINTYTLLVNLARIFVPWLAIPTNIFNPGSWLTGLNESPLASFDPLSWPLQAAFVNPILDQSRFSFLAARWSDCDTVTKDINSDSGCIWRAYTWLPEDKDSPHTELTGLVDGVVPLIADGLGKRLEELIQSDIDAALRPTGPCVVFANENKSGIGGPTGTALDGVFNLVASTADDTITEFLYDVDENSYVLNPVNGTLTNDQPTFAAWLGEIPAPPSVVYRDLDVSGILEAERNMHKMSSQTIMVGGKSPSWVNQLITFGIRYALSQLQLVVTVPWEGTGPAPINAGLDNIYQGQLDDVFLAYQRWTDPIRPLRAGAMGFQETFEQGGGTAYTVAGILTIRQGLWKTRAYQSFKANIQNGFPWLYGRDFTLGDRVGFEIFNIIHADNVHSVKYEWDRQRALTYSIAIGDDTMESDPTARVMRTAQNIWNMVGMALGSQDMF